MLESVEHQERWGRIHLPRIRSQVGNCLHDGKMTIRNGSTHTKTVKHPGEEIKELLKEYTSPKVPGLPTFTGGLVGYFSYDYVKYSEPKLNLDAEDTEGFKDVDVMLFDKVIAFDNLRQKIVVIANARMENIEEEHKRCCAELDEIVELIRHGTPTPIEPGRITSEFRSLFSEKEYCDMVERAKKYIYEGTFFRWCFPIVWRQIMKEAS